MGAGYGAGTGTGNASGGMSAFTVSQVNNYIKGMLDQDWNLRSILVQGEISNYKVYPSGHHYFSLKDAESSLRCVMFRNEARGLNFKPANGMQVFAMGRITVFPRDGQYQLYVSSMLDDGRGRLDMEFEKLRSRLEAEGLFDARRKKPLPAFPRRIAVVTSTAGAAVRDICQNVGQRWPMTEILVVPTRVQGAEAPGEIAAAIRMVNARSDIDIIITGRGGGSREDLWAFNEEVVARAIAASRIPVISAVGHEPDVSISDYVADAVATTPTKAGEVAVPSQEEWKHRVQMQRERLVRAEKNRISMARKTLERLRGSRVMQSAMAPIQERRMLLDSKRQRMGAALSLQLKDRRRVLENRQQRMSRAVSDGLKKQHTRLAKLAGGLDAMSPLKVLARGYAVARKDGNLISRLDQAEVGDNIAVTVTDGSLHCTVYGKESS